MESNLSESKKVQVTVAGSSRIPVSFGGISVLLSSLLPDIPDFGVQLPQDKQPLLAIKMDNRSNVKSTFMKLDVPETGTGNCTIYTGAIESEWDDQFLSSDQVTSSSEALLFIALFALKKYYSSSSYDMKLTNMPNTRVDDSFQEIKSVLQQIIAQYPQYSELFISDQSVAAPSRSISTSTSSSSNTSNSSNRGRSGGSTNKQDMNPNYGKPVEDTPQADIPEDLDLLSPNLNLDAVLPESSVSDIQDTSEGTFTDSESEFESAPDQSVITPTLPDTVSDADLSYSEEEVVSAAESLQDSQDSQISQESKDMESEVEDLLLL